MIAGMPQSSIFAAQLYDENCERHPCVRGFSRTDGVEASLQNLEPQAQNHRSVLPCFLHKAFVGLYIDRVLHIEFVSCAVFLQSIAELMRALVRKAEVVVRCSIIRV